mgnify:CR=1 FL=1
MKPLAIYPKDVKSKMIDVKSPIKDDDFVNLLKDNDEELRNIDIPPQCHMIIKQQGGKCESREKN